MTLISENYQDQLAQQHKRSAWGHTAEKYVDVIVKHAQELNENKLLDYGAGRGGLTQALKRRYPKQFTVTEYEPGRAGTRENNTPHNYVVSIDVLEHIEPEFIDNVLDDLKRCTLKGGYYTVSTRPAAAILPDGRNAHLIVEPFAWWEAKIAERFTIVESSFDEKLQRGFFYVKPKAG
jgi:2-polyprenyl-3-methyl-5-hydroxy-6-metoxy-1,4-benzoquinol methylase